MSNSYRDLIAWQKAFKLSIGVYRLTEVFPKSEIYGLTSQLRRAAVSVVSNIAEGQGRKTKGEFQQFLGQSKGSLLELETQLLIAAEMGYASREIITELLRKSDDVSRLVNGLILSLNRKSPYPERFDTRNEKRETRN